MKAEFREWIWCWCIEHVEYSFWTYEEMESIWLSDVSTWSDIKMIVWDSILVKHHLDILEKIKAI